MGPHETGDRIKVWEEHALADITENEEIFGEYPPVADIQAQMWHQLREHMTHEEALEYMHGYFATYDHIKEPDGIPPAA